MTQVILDADAELDQCAALMTYLNPDTAPEWEIRRNTADVLLEGLIELVAECQEELAPFGFDC